MRKDNLLKNYIILFLFVVILEIVFRFISGLNIWDTSMIRISLGASILALILSYLFSWVQKRVRKYFIIAISFLLSLYAFLQLGFNNFIGVYISINTKSQFGAVKDYVREFLSSFLKIYYCIFIPFLLLILYYVFIDKHIGKKIYKKFVLKSNGFKENVFKTLIVSFLLIVETSFYNKTLVASFMQDDLQIISAKELFDNPSVPSLSVNEFGVLGYGFLDIKSYCSDEYVEEHIYYVNADVEVPSNREIDDTLWDKVIALEPNKELNEINKYLKNQSITDYNDYTGLFEDKNLIVLMLESVNDIITYLPEYYPNFAKIYNEGWAFSNHYSPRNSCATGNNEFSGMTGLYTIYNNCTANVYKNNTYFESLFNLFKAKGYRTSSMHNYLESYYYRKTIHKNLGSERYVSVE